ncbi:MAG: serine hydrolase, partial [Acidobacteria bacterium]|nr:serine hydrolase [Acidobacteriota bacterium]
ATIVERISGEAFGTFVTRRIFEPLGMTSARFYSSGVKEIRARAIGYVDSKCRQRRSASPLYLISITSAWLATLLGHSRPTLSVARSTA